MHRVEKEQRQRNKFCEQRLNFLLKRSLWESDMTDFRMWQRERARRTAAIVEDDIDDLKVIENTNDTNDCEVTFVLITID